MQVAYRKVFKRLLDLFLASVGLIILSPLLIVVAILIKLKLGSPVIFKQPRPGKDGKVFSMYKFRTMTDEKDDDGILLSDGERLTKFGKVLRSTSLDELPELINIIKGDMAIVGPRPLLVKYLSLYNDDQKKRHNVRPGLTGLAQINGRNQVSWKEKFDLDIEYVNNCSFTLDMKIVFKTIFKVLSKEGISSNNSETTEEFRGN